MNVFVTGAKGFIGSNLVIALRRRPDVSVLEFDLDSAPGEWEHGLAVADAVFHLAGANRPEKDGDFEEVNAGLTRRLCGDLAKAGRTPILIFSSSAQAGLENPYGLSKRRAEEIIASWSASSGASAIVFRLPGVFGKWGRPNYNSVVATFCHNTAHGLPLSVSDESKTIRLVHVDDVVAAFLDSLDRPPGGFERRDVRPEYEVTLGDLARRIRSFRAARTTHTLDDFAEAFQKKLYGTYLTYLEPADLAYGLDIRRDARGELAEFLKQPHFGQVFVSRTKPGVTRGNHAHDSKAEKFLVLEGDALIRLRRIDRDEVLEYRVTGDLFRVLDIPPGTAHSITNIGPGTLITLFWADEVFDTEAPDTIAASLAGDPGKGTAP